MLSFSFTNCVRACCSDESLDADGSANQRIISAAVGILHNFTKLISTSSTSRTNELAPSTLDAEIDGVIRRCAVVLVLSMFVIHRQLNSNRNFLFNETKPFYFEIRSNF